MLNSSKVRFIIAIHLLQTWELTHVALIEVKKVQLQDAGSGVLAFYSRAPQSPACALLLVRLPLRNQLCLMDFLIVWPE